MTEDLPIKVEAAANDSVIVEILARLKDGLDASLCYHCPAHTEDVVQQTLTLATLDSLDTHSMLLLAIAAAFHDAGFLATRSGHERISADMAATAMSADQRFSQADIELVGAMIMDTEVYQTGAVHRPKTNLSPWLLDADLANFGRDDFFEQFYLVAKENKISPENMVLPTLDLMDRHTWQSPAGRACFDQKKRANRQALTEALSR